MLGESNLRDIKEDLKVPEIADGHGESVQGILLEGERAERG